MIDSRHSLGNPFAHQGLAYDAEIGSYQNRARQYAPAGKRFMQRDPLALAPRPASGFHDGMSLYQYARSNSIRYRDFTGRGIFCVCKCLFKCGGCAAAVKCVGDAGNYCGSSQRQEDCGWNCEHDPLCEEACVTDWTVGSGTKWTKCMQDKKKECEDDPDLTQCANCIKCWYNCAFSNVL